MNVVHTIDSDSPHFAPAVTEARIARECRDDIRRFGEVARFYSVDRHGVTPDQAGRLISLLLTDRFKLLQREQWALRRLNVILLEAGGAVGAVFLIDRQLYRVCNPGCLAIHIGQELPGDDEADDAVNFSEMIRFPQ